MSLWSWVNQPEELNKFKNPLFEANSLVIWPSVAPQSLQLWEGMLGPGTVCEYLCNRGEPFGLIFFLDALVVAVVSSASSPGQDTPDLKNINQFSLDYFNVPLNEAFTKKCLKIQLIQDAAAHC